MAPLPKPKDQRRRRNVGQAQWRQLPSEGRAGSAPVLPDREAGWLDGTRAWWDTIWASPMATAWLEADVESLVRLAALKDDFARGTAPATALPAMQQLEDRFGMSPKARRALQWEVAQVEKEAPALAVVKPLPIKDPRGRAA